MFDNVTLLKHRIQGPMVVEGGAFHVDGEGTVLATEQSLLNPNRNENLWPEEIERILRGHLGAEKVVWLGGGLVDDLTDGHVDSVACFAAPGVVLALVANDPEDANYRVLQDNLERYEKNFGEIREAAAPVGDAEVN